MTQPITYATSRDYALLAEEMKRRRLVCFVDYGDRCGAIDPPLRDVAATRYMPDSVYAPYRIQARGMGYVEGTLPEFLSQCAAYNVEWIP